MAIHEIYNHKLIPQDDNTFLKAGNSDAILKFEERFLKQHTYNINIQYDSKSMINEIK
jgi:hypothetical protein